MPKGHCTTLFNICFCFFQAGKKEKKKKLTKEERKRLKKEEEERRAREAEEAR